VQDEKMIAFLFGLISHQESDSPYHWSSPNGILFDHMYKDGKEGPFEHQMIEKDWDIILFGYDHRSGKENYIELSFYSEEFKQLIRAASSATSGMTPAPPPMVCRPMLWWTYCTEDKFDTAQDRIISYIGYVIEEGKKGTSDFFVQYMTTYPLGGIIDGAELTAAVWAKTWNDLMEDYPAPITTLSINPEQPDGNNGWYLTQPVMVELSATGALEPLVTQYRDSDNPLQQYTAPFAITTEGIHQMYYFSKNALGMAGAAKYQEIKIDLTPPMLNGGTTTLPNGNGWYNADATVHFDAEDWLSGLDILTPDQALTEEGADQLVIGTAVDLAGNSASFTVGPINIDKTPPAISGETTALPNENGWYNTDVTVHFTAEDLLSGLDTLTSDQTLVDEGAGQSVIGTAVDLAGNSASFTVGPINIDKTPPVVTVSLDKDRYTKTEPFTAHFNGSDALSGLSSLTAEFNGQSVTDGQVVDLFWFPLGTHTLTVRAEDLAGNVTETSQSIELSATLESLKETVARLCTEGYITKNSTCHRLSARLDAAIVAQNRGHDGRAANLLCAFQNAVRAQTDKSIQGLAAQLLLLDSEYIKDTLSR
jgi:hypothetical protein